MKYLNKFNEDNAKKDSPMKRLLSKGKDIEEVTEYKPKNTKHREEVGRKNKEFLDKVEQWTKENDKGEENTNESMKYLHKFNEDNLPDKKISNDRVNEIIEDLDSITSVVNQNLDKCKIITKELSVYTSKSTKNNTQIDDAFVNFESLSSKLRETITLIGEINSQLNDYNKNGESNIY